MSAPRFLWQIAVRVAPEAEDAAAESLSSLTGLAVTICRDARTQVATVSAFLPRTPRRPAWLRAEVRRGLARLATCGLDVRHGRVSLRKVRQEDWAESWKRHFPPLAIGRRLLVKPGWCRRKPLPGQAMVVLDPGLSFGTGQHPTTRFCLTQVVAAQRPDTRQSFLDIGTGSGILAIAAVKLGYRSVRGFDFDPQAVRVARENARRNGVAAIFKPRRGDLRAMPVPIVPRYDVICANLLTDLLLTAKERILAHLRPGGRLIVAGILAEEFGEIRRAYERAGLRLLAERCQREWRSGCFLRPG